MKNVFAGWLLYAFVLVFSIGVLTESEAGYWWRSTAGGGQTSCTNDGYECARLDLLRIHGQYSSFVGCTERHSTDTLNLVGAECKGKYNNSFGAIYSGLATLYCYSNEIRTIRGCEKISEIQERDPGTCTRVGNPVDAKLGVKVEKAIDYQSALPNFQFVRQYWSSQFADSVRTTWSRFGQGWRSPFDAMVSFRNSGSRIGVTVTYPDGRETFFRRVGSTWQYSPERLNPVTQTWSAAGAIIPDRVEWDTVLARTILTTPEGKYTFNNDNRLIEVVYPGGYTLTLAWTTTAPIVNTSVVDSYGNTITFSHNSSGLVTQAIMPGGRIVKYLYKSLTTPDVDQGSHLYYVLEKAIYPDDTPGTDTDNPTVQYHYENTTRPYLLTGKTDEHGVRVATWTYGTNGFVTKSEGAGGLNAYDISVDLTNGRSTVTNPLGKDTIYHFSRNVPGNTRLTKVEGVASANCGASNTTYGYDTNGHINQRVDGEGRVAKFVNDSRGRPTSITEGFGAPEQRTTSVTWHTTWNKPTQIVQPGLTTDMTYTTSGSLETLTQTDTTSHTVPFSTNGRTRVWAYTYDTGGQVTSVDGPLPGTGDTISYTYNSSGFLDAVTNELGHVTDVTAWDADGQPTSVTDANGTVTEYSYDPRGRLIGIEVDPSNNPLTWTMTYTAAGDVATIATPGEGTYIFTYNDSRRLTEITSSDGSKIEYDYDLMGNRTLEQVKTSGGTTRFEITQIFDELGRLIAQVGGENRSWSFAYDLTDNLTTITDPASDDITRGYDALNRLIGVTERDGGAVAHGYNGKDEAIAYTDPRGLATSYVRNGFGEIIQETSPDRGTTIYDHNALGLVTTKTDARSETVTSTYDAAGRLTGRDFFGTALDEIYTYDDVTGSNKGIGRLTGMADGSGSSAYAYNSKGQLTSEVRVIGGQSHTIAYTYDTAGRMETVTHPSGRIVTYTFDALGQVDAVEVQEPGGPVTPLVTSADYYPFGRLSEFAFGNGVTSSSAWDKEGAPSQIEVQDTSNVFLDRFYSRDTVGSINLVDDDATDTAETQTLTYDAAARLKTASGTALGSIEWFYDPVGNRTKETLSGTDEYIYDYPFGSNLLTSITNNSTTVRAFTYDGAGNTVQDVRDGVAYDYRISSAGRIDRVTIGGTIKANYTYDGRNRLAIREVLNSTPSGTQHFIHDQFDRIIAETDGAGTAVREYIWIGSKPVAVLDGTANPSAPVPLYVVTDHLDRPVMMLDDTTAVVWKASYKPFGEVRQITGIKSMDLRFPGQWFQLEAGLHYNWHRSYDPTIGRYTQPDPLGDRFDVPPMQDINVAAGEKLKAMLGQINDRLVQADYGTLPRLSDNASITPQRDGPNLFGYAHQSPITKTDPMGLLSSLGLGGQDSGTSSWGTQLCLSPSDDCKKEVAGCRALCQRAEWDPDMRSIWFGSLSKCMGGCVSVRCGGNSGSR